MKVKKALTVFLAATVIASNMSIYSFAGEESSIDTRGDFNAKIVTVANTVSYLTIDAKNLSSPIKSLYLDGKIVEFSKVSDDQKIVKAEFDAKNPNPKEVKADNVVDYGENIKISYNLNNEAEKNKYNRIRSVYKVYKDGHEEN